MTAAITAPARLLPLEDSERAQAVWEEFLEVYEAAELSRALVDDECIRSFLQAVLMLAPHLRDGLLRYPALVSKVFQPAAPDAVTAFIEETRSLSMHETTERDLMDALRHQKRKVALVLALLDLAGLWPMERVTAALSDFADAALLAALRFSLLEEAKRGKIELTDENEPEMQSGLIVLAMGKHGARELNYSSDIDLIIFYDPTRLAMKEEFERQPTMVRLVKRLVKIMQERTEHGYVFRTDLRLRPDPGATAVAISSEAALNYYESIGQNWERAAYIKARPVACDQEAADAFLRALAPFIWRKYMDFAMIAEVHAMKRQMHLHKGFGDLVIKGHNVKLGQGGIREIEFFVQTQQLIAGGRNADLRKRDTLSVLRLLADCGWIDRETAGKLADCYRLLRNIEHRIQMRHDEQTHNLPKDEEGLKAIAQLCGYAKTSALEQELLACFQTVSHHYGKLFEESEADKEDRTALSFPALDDAEETIDALRALGFEKPTQVSAIVRQWYAGHYKAMRSNQAREALEIILPKLLTALARSGRPDAALFVFDDFFKNLPAGLQLFGLLKANHHLLDLLVTLMGSAPRLADTIARRPHVFDAVLEPAFFGTVPNEAHFKAQLEKSLADARDYQDRLDRTRIFVQEQQFLIGTRLLSGTITPLESQAIYADLADSVVQVLLDVVVEEMAIKHGVVPGADVAVLAMGKLGGREMSPTSDLDLILIYDANADAVESTGARPLAVSQYFARITQRFISALSAPTGEGVAYEVDMRLRPSGKAGPLATEISAFSRYQAEAAWTWEHMALTRARVIGGSDALRECIEQTIDSVLRRERSIEKLRHDVVEMNDRLHDAKKPASSLGLKEARGGLIDVEFIVQYAQLASGAAQEKRSPNTREALLRGRGGSFLSSEATDLLLKAFDTYSSQVQLLRLCVQHEHDPQAPPHALQERLCALADVPDFTRLLAYLDETKASVAQLFDDLLR